MIFLVVPFVILYCDFYLNLLQGPTCRQPSLPFEYDLIFFLPFLPPCIGSKMTRKEHCFSCLFIHLRILFNLAWSIDRLEKQRLTFRWKGAWASGTLHLACQQICFQFLSKILRRPSTTDYYVESLSRAESEGFLNERPYSQP